MFSKAWFIAAGIRAAKTFAQTIIGLVAVGAAIFDIDWKTVLSVAAVATFLSLLTSVAGLPELKSDGVLNIDSSDPDKLLYNLVLDSDLESLSTKKSVTFKVLK